MPASPCRRVPRQQRIFRKLKVVFHLYGLVAGGDPAVDPIPAFPSCAASRDLVLGQDIWDMDVIIGGKLQILCAELTFRASPQCWAQQAQHLSAIALCCSCIRPCIAVKILKFTSRRCPQHQSPYAPRFLIITIQNYSIIAGSFACGGSKSPDTNKITLCTLWCGSELHSRYRRRKAGDNQLEFMVR